jgi:hypothetical protein
MIKLTQVNRHKWQENAVLFLAPLGIIYLSQVSANLGDGFEWSDFAITPVMMGAISLYVVNTLLDLLRKLQTHR